MKKVLLILTTILILPFMVNAKTYNGVGINDGTYFYNGDIIKNIKGLPIEDVELTYTNKEEATSDYEKSFIIPKFRYPLVNVRYYVIDKENKTNIEYYELYPNSSEYDYTNFKQYEPYVVYDENNDRFTEYGYKMTVGTVTEHYDNEVPNVRWMLKGYNEKDRRSDGCAAFWLNSSRDYDTGNIRYYPYYSFSGCYYGYSYKNTMELNMYEAEPAEPEIKITCDKETLKKNESTNCELQIAYKYEADELQFSLDSVNSKIYDIKLNENWKLTDGVYSIKGDTPEKKEYLANISKGLEVATFNAKYENTLGVTNPDEEIQITIVTKEVTLKNDIENVIAEDKKVNIPITTKEENTPGTEDNTPNDEEIDENPETGIYDYIAVVSLIIIASVLFYTKIKEISSFKGI